MYIKLGGSILRSNFDQCFLKYLYFDQKGNIFAKIIHFFFGGRTSKMIFKFKT